MEPNEQAVGTNSVRIVGALALLMLVGTAGALAWMTLGAANPTEQPAAEKQPAGKDRVAVGADKRTSPASARRPAADQTPASSGTDASQQFAQADTTETSGREEDPARASAKQSTPPSDDLPPDPVPQKVPAPPLTGGVEWLNTAEPVTLESLKIGRAHV